MQEEYYINWSVHTVKYKVYKIEEENMLKSFDKKSDAEDFIKQQQSFIEPIEYNSLKDIQIVNDGEWAIHFKHNGQNWRMAMCMLNAFDEDLQSKLKEIEEMVKSCPNDGNGLYKIK